MAKYLVLYRSSVDALQQMASASPEQAQEGMAQWMRWAGQAGTQLVDMINPSGSLDSVPSYLWDMYGTLLFRVDDGTQNFAGALRSARAAPPLFAAPPTSPAGGVSITDRAHLI